MKTLYLECNMGAAGDMLNAALYELLSEEQKKQYITVMNQLFPDVAVQPQHMEKCGITGTHMHVSVHGEEEESGDVPDHDHEHHHEHGHHHDHDEHDHEREHDDEHDHEREHDDEHDHEHGHHHDHEHDDEHDHEHGHHHDHEHDDEHDHEHGHHHDHEHDEHDHEHGHHHDHEHDDEHDHEHGHHHDHEHDEHDHEHGHHHDHDHEHGHHHHDHGHHHTSLSDIEACLDRLPLPEKVIFDAKAVYQRIAKAEIEVHGREISDIHFHEVGTMDAVADVTGVCLLMDYLSPDEIVASPVHVGSGFVRCMHGVLPVPAPATALLLKGVPSYSSTIEGELCTPTGAAILSYFVSSFGPMPVMSIEKIGYGMGKKEFPRANMLRAFLGEKNDEADEITRLECNLDDMTGEEIGFAMEQLFAAGARDVYTQAIGMKKSRPGILLSCICLKEDAQRMASMMLKYTTTLGVRREDMVRYVLKREKKETETSYGKVSLKVSSGYGVKRTKLEYEDIAELARKENLSLMEIRERINRQ